MELGECHSMGLSLFQQPEWTLLPAHSVFASKRISSAQAHMVWLSCAGMRYGLFGSLNRELLVHMAI